jgi:soluble lytic murein transglycosylase
MKTAINFVLLMALACSGSSAFGQQGDQRILAAHEALRTGDQATLSRLAATPEQHVLDHYVSYWLLLNKLARTDPPPTTELAAHIAAHPDGVTAERLRLAWLKRLAADKDWGGVLQLSGDVAAPDAELRCLIWHARQRSGDPVVLREVAQQWLELADAHEACQPVLQAAVQKKTVDENAVWWHFRRQIDSRSPERAHDTLAWLHGPGHGNTKALRHVIKSPAAYLDRLPANFAVTRSGREFALAALVRLARQDALAAAARFARISNRLGNDELSYVHVAMALHAAQSRLPQAMDWFGAAGEVPMTDAQREWRVRAALRASDWPRVERYIKTLPQTTRAEPEWVYWSARARAAQGHISDAQTLYASIATNVDYYGLLAAEALGQPFNPPPPDTPPTAQDLANARNDPGLQRSLALYRLGLRTEAVREWIRAVQGRDAPFLVAAAHLALAEGHYDRAINTAELADPRANFDLRFITPYRNVIEPQVRNQNLDIAWVYGLMRQESRFIVPARSHAGAQGLMQVMPATGKWVAKKIGLQGYHRGMLTDPDTNVQLGTSYMRMILDDLDNHPVLAAAGYNAGPGRARRWRDTRPIDATLYVATIPIDETRDYVQKVLANAVIYAAMLEQRPQSLAARLGIIDAAPSN